MVVVMVKLQVEPLPLASVVVHVTAVVPKGKMLPGAGVQVRAAAGSQLSVAVAVYQMMAPEAVAQLSVRPAGQLMIGGVESTTVTVVEQEVILPNRSVAV
jgi:hypothetical protein